MEAAVLMMVMKTMSVMTATLTCLHEVALS